MIKKKFIVLMTTLITTSVLSTISASALEMDKKVVNQTNSNVTDTVDMNSEGDIRFVSDEEYFDLVSKSENISIEEAKAQYDREIAEHKMKRMRTRSISWISRDGNYNKAIVYKICKIDKKGKMKVEIGAPATVYINGSFREFTKIGKAYAKAASSGSYKFDSFTKDASLSKNKLSATIYSRGNIEIKTSQVNSAGLSVSVLKGLGFEYSTSISGDTYYRKTVTLSHTEKLY